ncbi:hypothetical protein VFPPC_17789 [Pochonia chlamydosporia 170]|uniref:Uncharacterized protein n=1 Tax=Pochonia chlamydosporia 170 TaxID=1380566 RepID=A0A219AQF4_METCM|nr:hypothetical protein VFPPC_17789 [Pochonia chlamydosporia 170]OWT43018.1 hypothetical protein VFPPC_17789 [Pochonia chlamydosporia 170]
MASKSLRKTPPYFGLYGSHNSEERSCTEWPFLGLRVQYFGLIRFRSVVSTSSSSFGSTPWVTVSRCVWNWLVNSPGPACGRTRTSIKSGVYLAILGWRTRNGAASRDPAAIASVKAMAASCSVRRFRPRCCAL